MLWGKVLFAPRHDFFFVVMNIMRLASGRHISGIIADKKRRNP